MGLAPTTSTTMSLALGDARGCIAGTQRIFRPRLPGHPGGKLGSSLLRVWIMREDDAVPLVEADIAMQTSSL